LNQNNKLKTNIKNIILKKRKNIKSISNIKNKILLNNTIKIKRNIIKNTTILSMKSNNKIHPKIILIMKVGKDMFKENIKKENIIKDYGFMLLLSLSFVHCSACSWVDASEI
jgi:hypothetical protein